MRRSRDGGVQEFTVLELRNLWTAPYDVEVSLQTHKLKT